MSDATQSRPVDTEPSGAVVVAPSGTRIDAAHILGSGPPAATGSGPELAEIAITAADVDSLAAASELIPRVRLQGRQLARLLAERQQELDHREAQQNALAAELEAQMRSARAWFA